MINTTLKIKLVLTFTLVGLWHKISIGYLIWGLAHGFLLAAHMRFSVSNIGIIESSLVDRVIVRALSTTLTLTIVALLSTSNNLNDSTEIPDYLFSLIKFK